MTNKLHINRQKQIEKEVEKINQRASEIILQSHKKMALFIDPVPDSFLTQRDYEYRL